MNDSTCSADQLSLLIQNELSPAESSQLMEHLESCSDCQSILASISAQDSWWQAAKRGLQDATTDEHGWLPEVETAGCAIETFLEDDADGKFDRVELRDPFDPPSHPELLGRIDEFEVEEKIGQGGMGIVYRGFERSLNRPVAIKMMASHLGANGVARQRFAREARAAAAVVHPNVIPIYRVSEDKSRPYIAMALVDGPSLQEHVQRQGPLEIKDVVRVSIQIADGLAAAHQQGLIHRDIKPANVLMEKDVSRIMITDFGLARAVDDVVMTQSGCLAGTPNYMSPEQVNGGVIDHRSDLFSLGSLMYFIATGREPFRGENAFAVINKISTQAAIPARSVNAEVPVVLSRIIDRLLQKNSNERIQSAEELKLLLTQLLAYLQDPDSNTQPCVKPVQTRRAIPWPGVIAGIVILALAGYMIWDNFLRSSPITNPDDQNRLEQGSETEHDGSEHHRPDGHDRGHD